MSQCLNAILYAHLGNPREGKSTSGVGNPCAPHPLNKSLAWVMYMRNTQHACRCTTAIEHKGYNMATLQYPAGPTIAIIICCVPYTTMHGLGLVMGERTIDRCFMFYYQDKINMLT